MPTATRNYARPGHPERPGPVLAGAEAIPHHDEPCPLCAAEGVRTLAQCVPHLMHVAGDPDERRFCNVRHGWI